MKKSKVSGEPWRTPQETTGLTAKRKDFDMLNGILIGSAVTALLGSTAIVGIAGAWILAESDLVFTTVREGTAKAVVAGIGTSKEFKGMVMRMQGRCFKFWESDPIERYEVVDVGEIPAGAEPNGEDPRRYLLMLDPTRVQPGWLYNLKRTSIVRDFLAGLYYIGLPTYGIKKYTFKWTSVEQKEDGESNGKERAQNILLTTEKPIDYIYLLEDVYAFVIDKADLGDMMENDIEVTFSARVINPYKALFTIEKWLEAITISLSKEFIPFVATLSTKGIHSLMTGQKAMGSKIDLDVKFQASREKFLKDYGVDIWNIGILSADPTEAVAALYSAAQVRRVTAQAEADATKIQAEADAYAIDQEYAAIGKYPHGPRVRDAEAIEKSGLKTLATGNTGIALAVPTDENGSRRRDQNDTQHEGEKK